MLQPQAADVQVLGSCALPRRIVEHSAPVHGGVAVELPPAARDRSAVFVSGPAAGRA